MGIYRDPETVHIALAAATEVADEARADVIKKFERVFGDDGERIFDLLVDAYLEKHSAFA